MDPVTRYANDVYEGNVVAGPLVRKACARHLRDIESDRGLEWRPDLAQRAIEFFPDVLRLAEGEHAGQPFWLQPWQQFIVGSLFGWLGPDGYRRFRTAYVEIGKGNGKSPMAGGMGIYMMVADGEAGAHCYAAATTRDQADILFQDAVKMVSASPVLKARIQISGKLKVHNLAHLASGSFFRAISAENRGLDGKRVAFAALDEVHEHPTAIVVDKMRAGTKGRRQALIFEITNSGFDRHTVCWQHHEYSEKILDDVLPNDSWFAYVCGLDEKDDYRDPKNWVKANPNLGISITEKYLREQVDEADGMPSKANIVKRLNFCVWTEQSERWMSMEEWDACMDTFDPAELAGEDCYGGLDLASTTDASSLCLLFPPSAKRKKWAALWFYWVPRDNIAKRAHKDHVPYDLWAEQGVICATPGNTTDYDQIRRDIAGTYLEAGAGELGAVRHDKSCLADKYRIVELAYDRWNATQLITQMGADGLTMVPVGQGFQTQTSALREIERIVLGKEIGPDGEVVAGERKFMHNQNPMVRWNASNIAVAIDPAGNIKLDKARSTERIDGMSAFANAMARASVMPVASASVYESRGLLTI